MHYSGVLVVTAPQRLETCANDLSERLGIEVSHRDPSSGRMIAVLESASVKGLERALRRIREQRDVLLAEPVSLYVDRPAGGKRR